MIKALRRTFTVLLVTVLGLGFSLSASAQDAVLSSVSVRVNPGQMDEYMSQVKKLQGVMKRLEVDSNVEAWQVTAGGPTTGTTFVALEYPSLVAYAENSEKVEGDSEYQKLISGLDALRTVQSVSLYRQVSGPGRTANIPTGSVLQTVFVRVKPGRLDDYVAEIDKLRKISDRLGASSTMRVWQATAAGDSTGAVVVGVLYKDLVTYAADSTKIQGDSEWQKLIGGLDEIRTIVSSGLSRNVGP